MSIHDAPRFAWRGLMLDSARHYQSPAFVKKLIDVMALHKLNVLHWHLTDDQAWRLEIENTRVLPQSAAGASPPARRRRRTLIRRPTGRACMAASTPRPRSRRSSPTPRRATSPSCPRSRCLATPCRRSWPIRNWASDGRRAASIQSDWGVFPYLYNLDDHTFAVLEDVLTEVMALFPSPCIHVGGDEAVKDQWKASPRIQAQMKALGIASEDELQGWFTASHCGLPDGARPQADRLGRDSGPCALAPRRGRDVLARDRRRHRRRQGRA